MQSSPLSYCGIITCLGQDRPKRKKSRRNKYELEDGAYSGDSDGTLFVSLAGRITHEHFLKVVPNSDLNANTIRELQRILR